MDGAVLVWMFGRTRQLAPWGSVGVVCVKSEEV